MLLFYTADGALLKLNKLAWYGHEMNNIFLSEYYLLKEMKESQSYIRLAIPTNG